MPEQTLWTGSPSQVRNLGAFIFCALLAVAIVVASLLLWQSLPGVALALLPVVYAFWKWLIVRARKYQLTTERLLISYGVFSKTTDSLELYRVKDLRITQPLTLRLFGLENIELTTSDQSSPLVVIDYMPQNLRLGDKLRAQIEACRVQKGTREIELE
jgi:uncharacterized membrane protein YdbT with pleckstrin-like domain